MVEYDYFPKPGKGSYNSNSFTRSLLQTIGYDISTIKMAYSLEGWLLRIPNNYF